MQIKFVAKRTYFAISVQELWSYNVHFLSSNCRWQERPVVESLAEVSYFFAYDSCLQNTEIYRLIGPVTV